MKFKKNQMIRIVGLSDLLLSINGYQRPAYYPAAHALGTRPPRQMVLRTPLVKAEPLYLLIT